MPATSPALQPSCDWNASIAGHLVRHCLPRTHSRKNALATPVLIGQIKLTRFHVADLYLPEGVGSNDTEGHLFTDVERSAHGLPGKTSQANLPLSKCLRRMPQDNGGARRDRTDDILLAKQALSQLSYGPIRGSTRRWWARVDSNYRPHAYQACALTT